MIHAYRYRLYPNTEQKAYFAKAFGCTRYVYNFYVREHERMWKEENKTATSFDLANKNKVLKEDAYWLNEIDSSILDWTARRVTNGWQYFFEHINSRPPHEHKKGERNYQSFTTSGMGLQVCFRQNSVRVPKIGWIRARLHRRFFGEIKCATIKLSATGKYFISIYVEERNLQVSMKPFSMDRAVGIDVGVRHFLTLSTGEHIDMPDMDKIIKRRSFLQRRLKQQKQGSKGYYRTRKQIAKLNEHIANKRLDIHNKIATDLCHRFDAICMETFSSKGMRMSVGKSKDRIEKGFNKKLNHVALSQFSEILENKAKKTGTHFNRMDRWEPSTKKCHVCGYICPTIPLGVKEWICPKCGTCHDRDVNAAINIKQQVKEQRQIHVVDERYLDEEKIKRQLPQAVREFKPVNEGINSDRWTGKMTGVIASRPVSQIDNGTARARLAIKLESINYLRLQPFVKNLNLDIKKVKSWFAIGVTKEDESCFYEFLSSLLKFGEKCRHTSVVSKDRYGRSLELLEMGRFVDLHKFTEETFHHGLPFTWWRTTKRTEEEIMIVNDFYTKIMPDIINKFVNKWMGAI